MPQNIEDYALIGDRETAALVGRDGSIDWLCMPRFDSPACFAALLGSSENGRWLIAPEAKTKLTRRKYRDDTLVLETEHETDSGTVRVIDCMPARDDDHPCVLRMVEGVEGSVAMTMELVLRFDYGSVVPWVQRTRRGIVAVAGPDAVTFDSDVELKGENLKTVARFTVSKKQRVSFVLTWSPSFAIKRDVKIDVANQIKATTSWWKKWASSADYHGPHRDTVVRSLITLKALTYAPTGAIVAAPTASLPEAWGGPRNWDYRYCWLRDATFTLYALMNAGYSEEARAWRDWLLRAIAGNAGETKAMYAIRGERRVEEIELPWLDGFHGAKPVRIGNAVHKQLQLDVYGEVCDALYLSARTRLNHTDQHIWSLQTKLMEFLEGAWQEPDEGMWEVRGPRRDFLHSKVMVWVAFDRSVKMIEELGLEGPIERWRKTRDLVHDEITAKGFDEASGAFVQYYGAREVDASALLMPLVGFLPPTDKRVLGTIRQIEKTLLLDGFVRRYRTKTETDGLPPGEGCFLPCSFWLADVYMLLGRRKEACKLFDRLVALTSDIGLLSEEYDPVARRFLGNFPQAFSHVALVNTARNLYSKNGPARHRHARSTSNKIAAPRKRKKK